MKWKIRYVNIPRTTWTIILYCEKPHQNAACVFQYCWSLRMATIGIRKNVGALFVIKILVQVLGNKLVYKSINIYVYVSIMCVFVFCVRRIVMGFI